MQDDLLGRVERGDDAAILLGQLQAALFHIQLAHGFEQRRLELEVLAQFAKQPGQGELYRLMGEQRVPDHREQAVPGGAGYQQQRFQPQAGDAAALLDADHAVHRENQGAGTQGGEAFTECAEHGQAEGGKGQGDDEQPGIGKEKFHRIGRRAEAGQGDQHRAEAALPAVVGLGQGAGDDAEKQGDQPMHPALPPAQRQGSGQGDEYPQAGAELVQCPEAAQ